MAEKTRLPEATGQAEFAPPPRMTARNFLRRNGITAGTLSVAVLMWLIFVIAAPDVFLSSRIYNSFAVSTPLFAMPALALTLVIITREIDLSFVSVMALAMVGFVRTYEFTGNVVLAIVACLLVGVACGLLNGFLVAKLGIPSLVITLGTMFFFRGIELAMLGGRGYPLTNEDFSGLRDVLNGKTLGVRNELVWTIVIAVILWVVLNRTRFGSHVFIVGDNATSAELMGIRVARVKITTYCIVGVVAAFAGLVSSTQVSFLWPTLGDGHLLTAIAAVVLGGTSIFGGSGSIVGTFVGAFVVGSINAGVISAGIDGFYTQLFFGLVIIVSLVIQTLIRRRMQG